MNRIDTMIREEWGEAEFPGWRICTCGYDLRATPLDSRCPECGRAVVSLQFRGLTESETGWLKRLRTGIVWLVLGYMGAIAFWVVSFR